MGERKPSGVLVPRLRALRQERGWGRYDLAHRARLSLTTIVVAERGKRVSRSTLNCLADALGVSREELLGNAEMP